MTDRIKRHFSWPLVGFLVLAAANFYAIQRVGAVAHEGRQELARSTQQTLRAACSRNNQTREAMTTLLISARNQTLVRKDLPGDRKRIALEFYEKHIPNLAPLDCGKLYPAK